MDTLLAHDEEILTRIAELELQRARIEAETSALMLEFADLRRSRADRSDDPRRQAAEVSWAADELGTVLHQPAKVVQDRLAQARRVRGLMPWTWVAHLAGRVDAYRVALIAAAVQKVRFDNHNVIHLDHMIGAYAETHTASQLKGRLKRFVARWGASSESVRAERAKRAVWCDHQDDGMSYLHAYLPTTDALRLEAELSETAKTSQESPQDDRSFEQRRADAFIAKIRGIVAGRTVSSRAVIGVVVPVTSLAGVDDRPGESFDGSFALPADLVRDLARQPGTVFHRVITDPLGRILDVTELGRFASEKLGIAIAIRDGTCRMPTCSRPALECDNDHLTPYPEGRTTGSNLRGLCRRHHNVKTHRIAEPTDMIMRPHAASVRRDDDLVGRGVEVLDPALVR